MVGFDPDRERARARASSSARSTAARDSVAEAVRGRRGRLLRRAGRRRCRTSPREALAAGGAGLRGHRRRLDQARDRRRARRPTSASSAATRSPAPRPPGVENARADLFEGARWYLTPTERSSGVLYDRLQRAIAGLGARPQAIDAETHDRLMATVSHLPHVLANVLVAQAATALSERGRAAARGRAELPRRDPGRRRQPGDLGRHLRHQPRGASPTRSTRSIARLQRGCATLIRAGDARARSRAWHAAAARRPPRAARGRARRRPAARAARRRCPTGPGSSPSSRWRSARPGSTSRTWRSTRRADMTSGAISLWVAGDEQARARRGARARARLPGGAGVTAMRRASTRPGPLRGALRAAARQVDLPPRGADRARWATSRYRIANYLDAADTRSTLRRGRGARRRGRASATASCVIRGVIDGVGAARRRARPRSTSATPARCCGCCPGWLAGQPGGELDARRRRLDPPPPGRPDRRAAARRWAPASTRRDGPPAAAHASRGAALRGHRLRAAGRQRPGQVVPAARRPARRGRDDRASSRCRRRDHTERMLLPRPARATSTARTATRDHGRQRRRARARTTIAVPGDFSSAAFFDRRRRCSCRGSEVAARGRRHSTGPGPGFLRILERMGARDRATSRTSRRRAAGEPIGRPRRPRLAPLRGHRGRAPTRCRWRSTSCRWSRCSAASPRARRSSAAPRELRRKESDRIADVVEGAARARRRDRGRPRTGSRSRGTGGLRGGTLDAHGDHRLAMLGAVAGLASREGVEVDGMDAAAVVLPGLRATTCAPSAGAELRPCMVVAIDGPAGAGKSTVARGVAERARLHLPRLGGDVPRVALARRWQRGRPAGEVARGAADRARRRGCCSTARRHRRDPDARGLRGAPRAWPPTRTCARRWSREQRRLIAAGDWVAEGRDIGTVVAPDAAVKVFLTADPRSARAAAPPSSAATPDAVLARPGAARRARPHARARARCAGRRRGRARHAPG